MTKLIIAEKPKAALAIAAALSPSYTIHEGYIQGSNDIQYTYALGHLVCLKDPGEYNPEWHEWKWDVLPMIPPSVSLKPIDNNAKKQLSVISKLAKNATEIYNFGDCAQEGEVIIFYVATYLGFTNKITKRIWTSSLQAPALRKAFQTARPQKEYEHLRTSGIVRTLSDWIIGLNATRALTLALVSDSNSLQASSETSGELVDVDSLENNQIASESENAEEINVSAELSDAPKNQRFSKIIRAGRIMTPVLALVYDRYKERDGFTKSFYYPIVGTFQQGNTTFEGQWVGERITNKKDAENLLNRLKGQESKVITVEDSDKETPPPLLMDLTAASKEANKRFGYSGKKTLGIIQSLYIKRLVTYPRTSSRFITEDEIPLMLNSFKVLEERYATLSANGNLNRISAANKRLVNPQKVEDHHAILPEPTIATDLTDDEKNIYEMIVERFFMQFQEPVKYKQRKMITQVGNETFTSTYRQVVSKGWKALISTESEDGEDGIEETQEGYPNVISGPAAMNELRLDAKETAPPPAYNDGTLMEIMGNISLRVTDPQLKEALKEKGIGTSATRAETIDKLMRIGYLKYEGKKAITITPLGIQIIEALRNSPIRLLTSPEMTAQWEMELTAIRNGKNPQKFNQNIQQFAKLIVEEAKKIEFSEEAMYESLGTCPQCGGIVVEKFKKYQCLQYPSSCNFFLWQKQYNKTITHKMVSLLLTKGQTGILSLTNKDKKPYKARFTLPQEITGNVQLQFEKKV